MPIEIKVETGVPMPKHHEKLPTKDGLVQNTAAAAATAKLLADNGLEIEHTPYDDTTAGEILTAFAEDPETTTKQITPKTLTTMRPAALIEADKILSTYGQQVVEESLMIRHLVTNKLLLESENEDAKVRLKALEMLGKISDVGLFAEKSEITITHQSTEELRETLRAKLNRIAEKRAVIDVTPTNIDSGYKTSEPKPLQAIDVTDYDYDDDADCDDILSANVSVETDDYDD